MSLECTLAFSFYIICKPATAAFFFLLWLQSVVHFDFFRLLVTALLLVSHYEFYDDDLGFCSSFFGLWFVVGSVHGLKSLVFSSLN